MAGRPRKHSIEQTLDTALQTFWTRGYANTSISDLSKALGVGPSSLYNTFGSKANLYNQCLTAYVNKNGHLMQDALAHPNLQTALYTLVMGYVGTYTQAGCPAGCAILNAPSDDDPQVQTLLDTLRSSTLQAVHARIQKGVDDGDLPADTSVNGMARFVMSVLQGMSLQARDGATADDLRALATASMLGLAVGA